MKHTVMLSSLRKCFVFCRLICRCRKIEACKNRYLLNYILWREAVDCTASHSAGIFFVFAEVRMLMWKFCQAVRGHKWEDVILLVEVQDCENEMVYWIWIRFGKLIYCWAKFNFWLINQGFLYRCTVHFAGSIDRHTNQCTHLNCLY